MSFLLRSWSNSYMVMLSTPWNADIRKNCLWKILPHKILIFLAILKMISFSWIYELTIGKDGNFFLSSTQWFSFMHLKSFIIFFIVRMFWIDILLTLNFSLLIFSLPCWIRDNLEFSYLINSWLYLDFGIVIAWSRPKMSNLDLQFKT